MEKRKKDHIQRALDSRTPREMMDDRFHYEPLLKGHPSEEPGPLEFLGKKMKSPLWISSMTGGTKMAGIINRNLARACHEFGMGMGLGSCRIIMDDDTYFEDFNMRPIIGEEYPFYANLGVAQVEEFISAGQTGRIRELLDKLQADGLVIHVNPLQEFCQPEGDRFLRPPIDTIREILEIGNFPVIVKEVGQGMGPESLKALLKLPLEAIEFAAFGGTNFSLVELSRSDPMSREFYRPLAYVGHDAESMVDSVNRIVKNDEDIQCRQLIISGGITDFLDGYYLINKSRLPAIYGQAGGFLKHARDTYEKLQDYIQFQLSGLRIAETYLTVKEQK
jgi:isopentenyl-diphosphate delta-isomerase